MSLREGKRVKLLGKIEGKIDEAVLEKMEESLKNKEVVKKLKKTK